MATLSDTMGLYLDSRRGQGIRPATIRNDRKDITKLLLAVGNIPVDRLEPRHIDALFAAQSHLSDSTSNQMHTTLSAFFKWCRAHRFLRPDQDPLAGRRLRKVRRPERGRVHLSQFPALLDAAGNHHPRDRAAVALGLFLMLRQSEIATLRIRDVDLQARRIEVEIHKTADRDSMPISSELDAELRTWLTTYVRLAGPLQPDWYLIPSKTRIPDRRRPDGTWERSTEQALRPYRQTTHLEDIVKRALEGIGYEVRDTNGRSRQEGFHTLRRSGARAVYEELRSAGYDGAMARVQAFLHHSSVTMTEKYLGLKLDRDLRDQETAGQPLLPSLAGVLSTHGESDDHSLRPVRTAG